MHETLEFLEQLIDPIAASGVPYMVTGSVASTLFGEIRSTRDVDVVLFLKSADVPKLVDAFPEERYYCPPIEAIRAELERARGMINVIYPATGLKADLFFAEQDTLYDWAFAHRKVARLQNKPYFFAPPEFVILKKLEYFTSGRSDKHIRDIEGIWFSHKAYLDQKLIEREVRQRGLADAWALVSKTPPSAGTSPRN